MRADDSIVVGSFYLSREISIFAGVKAVEQIVKSVESGDRLSAEDARTLWQDAPLWTLGRLATMRKHQASGDALYYNRNIHIEPTNICVFNCKFCSYRRAADSPEAWDYSIEQMEDMARAQQGKGITEVHIVGGVHPKHDLWFYLELIRRIKVILPEAAIKAFTAVELAYMIDRAGLSHTEGLQRLKDAGMAAIPGGGAEIFDEQLRAKICPEKGSTEMWLSMHEQAHRLGIPTNATILYGHVETLDQRIDHLLRLRNLQDRTHGFNAFIPLKYKSTGNSMGSIGEVSVVEDMKMLAMSRLVLDNFAHIKAYWVMYGKSVAEMALSFGADDIDGTIDDSTKIYSMSGAEEQHPRLTVSEIQTFAHNAGLRAVERDTLYNEIKR